jgi:hypothetical protein
MEIALETQDARSFYVAEGKDAVMLVQDMKEQG